MTTRLSTLHFSWPDTLSGPHFDYSCEYPLFDGLQGDIVKPEVIYWSLQVCFKNGVSCKWDFPSCCVMQNCLLIKLGLGQVRLRDLGELDYTLSMQLIRVQFLWVKETLHEGLVCSGKVLEATSLCNLLLSKWRVPIWPPPPIYMF